MSARRSPAKPRSRSRRPRHKLHPRRLLTFLILGVMLTACARSEPPPPVRARAEIPAPRASVDPRYGTSPSPRLYAEGQPIPKGGGSFKIGAPYQIAGRWYFPREEPAYDRVGIASWYGEAFHGRKTANGEIFDRNGLTAAHPTLPLPSYVWVTSEGSGRTILVRVNDRGPYARDRIIDLSQASARALGIEQKGLARVRVRYAGRAPLDGDDRREQAFLRQQPWHAHAGRPYHTPRRMQPDSEATLQSPTRWR
jgi:rare lipoprotein A